MSCSPANQPPGVLPLQPYFCVNRQREKRKIQEKLLGRGGRDWRWGTRVRFKIYNTLPFVGKTQPVAGCRMLECDGRGIYGQLRQILPVSAL